MTPGPITDTSPHGLTTCHECDLLHRLTELAPGDAAYCVRCGARLHRAAPGGTHHPLALASTAMVCFVVANAFPFMALNVEGRVEENLVISGVLAMWSNGMPALAVLVFLTSIAFPFLILVALLWLLVPLHVGLRAPGSAAMVRIVRAVSPWALMGVFLLGALIAFVKLQDIATVLPGVSMFAFAGLLVSATGALSAFDVALVWPRVGPVAARPVPPGSTARAWGLVACHTCDLLVAAPPRRQATSAHPHCPRCGSRLHDHRKHDSVARTWALVVSALILIVPANVYPVMTVIRFGQGEPSTILGGVVQLVAEDMWGLALIVFVASIVVPGLKLVLLMSLLVSVQRRSSWRPRERTRLYRVTEVVGAWSMVDIFLVAILSALVSLDRLATITPDVGASYFAAVVVITMFAAQSFDPRLIWDRAERRP